MSRHWWRRLFGALLIAAALPFFLFLPSAAAPVLAVALAASGAFVLLVLASPSVDAEAVGRLVRADSEALRRLALGLHLAGRAVYVHDQGNVGEERLFLPASTNDKPVPILDAATVVYAGGGSTKLGAALPPPGLRLLQEHERASGVALVGATTEEVEASLRALGQTEDFARDVRLGAEGDRASLRFRAGSFRLPCQENPSDEPPCETTGCAWCQAAGCALARSLGRPVLVERAQATRDEVVIEYRAPEAWT